METNLTATNIDAIKKVFGSRAEYEKHLKALGALRRVIYEQIQVEAPGGININTEHPLYPAFETANDLIGALLQPGYSFTGGILERDGQPLAQTTHQ